MSVAGDSAPGPAASSVRDVVEQAAQTMWDAIDDKGIEGRLFEHDCRYLAKVLDDAGLLATHPAPVPVPAAERERYEDLLSSIWLYINWRYVTMQLTTPQKTLFADAVDAFEALQGEAPVADRWWLEGTREPARRWPGCD